MHKRLGWGTKVILFIALLLCVPMHTYAYFGKNEDYKLSTEKPEDKSPKNYFEFVSEETYTVKCGDTLWEIAESYFGDGADRKYRFLGQFGESAYIMSWRMEQGAHHEVL